MQMIYAIVKISTHHITYKRTTYPYKRTITTPRFNKGCHSSVFNCHKFADSIKHAQLSASFFAL